MILQSATENPLCFPPLERLESDGGVSVPWADRLIAVEKLRAQGVQYSLVVVAGGGLVSGRMCDGVAPRAAWASFQFPGSQ